MKCIHKAYRKRELSIFEHINSVEVSRNCYFVHTCNFTRALSNCTIFVWNQMNKRKMSNANYIYDMVLNVFHRQTWKVFDKNRLNCIWFWMKYSSRQSIVELVFVCLTRALRVCNLIFVIYVYKSSPKAILFSTFSFSHRAHTHKNSSSENLIYKIIQSISGNGNNENKQNCCTQRFWPGF